MEEDEQEGKAAEEDEVIEEGVFERSDDEDDPSLHDVAEAVGEIYGGYKKAYGSASKGDKIKILLIVLPLVITFIIGFVGIFVANVGQTLAVRSVEITGLVLMGVGLGGFFLTIVLIIVISKLKH